MRGQRGLSGSVRWIDATSSARAVLPSVGKGVFSRGEGCEARCESERSEIGNFGRCMVGRWLERRAGREMLHHLCSAFDMQTMKVCCSPKRRSVINNLNQRTNTTTETCSPFNAISPCDLTRGQAPMPSQAYPDPHDLDTIELQCGSAIWFPPVVPSRFSLLTQTRYAACCTREECRFTTGLCERKGSKERHAQAKRRASE